MKKKQITLLVLLVLLVLAGTVLLLLTRQNEKAASESAASADGDIVLSNFATDDLKSISYVYGGEKIALQQTDGTWTLENDPAYQVNQTLANSMAAALCSLKAKRVIENVTDYTQYGTDAPTLTVTAEVADETMTFAYGASNTITGDVYLQMQGDANVYTVDAAKESCFDYGKADLYDTSYTPVTISRSAITGLTYHFEDGQENFTVPLEGRSEAVTDSASSSADASASSEGVEYSTVWYFADDSSTDVYQSDVTAMLQAITTCPTAQNTAPGDLAQYGLDQPLITVKISDDAGSEQTFALAIGADGGYYMMEDGGSSVFTVTQEMLQAFCLSRSQLALPADSDSTDADAALSVSLDTVNP